MFPHQVQLTLQITHIGGDSDDGILVGDNDDILSSSTIGTEAAHLNFLVFMSG